MLKNHKKLVVALLIVLLVGTAGWFTFASYSKKWLETRVDTLIADFRAKGATISYSTVKFKVTPISIKAVIKDIDIKDPQGLFEWQGQELKIFMRPFDYFTLNFVFPGNQKVVVPQHTSLPLGVLQLEEAQGVLHLTSHGHLENFTFTVGHLSSLLGNQIQSLSLQDLSLNVTHLANPLNLKVNLSTKLINVEKLFNKEPSHDPCVVNFVADLSGFKPEFPFPKSLAEWRDGGGVLEVRLLKINWPPILAEIEGTLTLDEGMYPLGSFSSRISGYGQAIDKMVELGWVKKKKATVALFMLDLFASSNETGEKQLKAPITLQNKTFSIGPAPLLKLQPISIAP